MLSFARECFSPNCSQASFLKKYTQFNQFLLWISEETLYSVQKCGDSGEPRQRAKTCNDWSCGMADEKEDCATPGRKLGPDLPQMLGPLLSAAVQWCCPLAHLPLLRWAHLSPNALFCLYNLHLSPPLTTSVHTRHPRPPPAGAMQHLLPKVKWETRT